MKAICTQSDLSRALDIVNRAISPNITLPVLNNILIKATGKTLYFSATNLEIAIHFSIKADVKNEGSITIPARLISSFVGLLEDESVDLRVDESLTLHIKTKTTATKIKGISAEEFPIIPKVEKEHSFSIIAEKLAEAIDQTVFSAAVTTTRPVLAGVYFGLSKDILKLAATDSYRLAEKQITLDKKSDSSIECIVPAKTLLELWRILSGEYGKEVV
ncbi:MAG: DNA polymerase III subunit beta, partial [Patescibacteria group bacterium]